ncbi:tripartite tricarboxylate transporter TctB family protein [Pararhizobium haloflavum]|uniref:tripartite tricarboxylate transporter TctB family protein n=1 Tax=Pararhizobium haloflavum TaxID=2037914 RepID=UPI0012FFE5AA|nr:tripartite tricarboxylate transporter TctB family protein [Pararhizobium haloflavum]
MARSTEFDVTTSSGPSPYLRPALEWAVWVGFALLAYSQTGLFDREIPEYRFGATGWPRAVCLLMIAGATGQFLMRCLTIARGVVETDAAEEAPRQKLSGREIAQRTAIFLLPLVYLYAVPYLGFYLMTPLFMLALMLILEVRSPGPLIGVPLTVSVIFLLVFTRLFYVGMPVGNLPGFYDVNNAIIGFARLGM